MSFEIRPATPKDAESLFDLVYQLAVYEKLEAEVISTPECMAQAIEGGRAEALLAEADAPGEGDGRAVGFAFYFYKYSTFVGTPVLHLEDLFVLPDWRGRGIGKSLFLHVARLARARGCRRMEWNVLDWNQPSIAFYEGLGARLHRDWLLVRLDEEGLSKLDESS